MAVLIRESYHREKRKGMANDTNIMKKEGEDIQWEHFSEKEVVILIAKSVKVAQEVEEQPRNPPMRTVQLQR